MSEEVEVQQVSEVVVPDASADEARKFGWVPKEEFKGNPDEWRDADAFLKKGREINGFLRKDLDKLRGKNSELESQLAEMKSVMQEFRKFHQETEERAYKKALDELKAEKKAALTEGDGDRAVEIDERIESLKEERTKKVTTESEVKPQQEFKPDPTFLSWAEDNRWYNTDRELTEFADDYAEIVRKRNPGLVGKEFLDTVKERVKRGFPEKFENGNRTRPSPVDGSSTVRPNGKGKTYADLPSEAKAACDKFVKQKLLSQAEYVKQYYSE